MTEKINPSDEKTVKVTERFLDAVQMRGSRNRYYYQLGNQLEAFFSGSSYPSSLTGKKVFNTVDNLDEALGELEVQIEEAKKLHENEENYVPSSGVCNISALQSDGKTWFSRKSNSITWGDLRKLVDGIIQLKSVFSLCEALTSDVTDVPASILDDSIPEDL